MSSVDLAGWFQPVWIGIVTAWSLIAGQPVLGNVFWATIATLGFSVLFNVPKYALPYCVLIGALGYATRAELMNAGMGLILAALLMGTLATGFARRFAVSEALFAISPAIPMVPGSYVYKAVLHLVIVANAPHLEHENEELLLTAFNGGAKAALIILLLSFVIALPGLIWSAIRRAT